MKRLALCVLLFLSLAAPKMVAQQSVARASASPGKAAAQPTREASPKPAAEASAKPAEKDPIKAAFGGNTGVPAGQPVTTEIYSDAAFFDSEKYVGTFTGRVIVKDPRFNIQADKLTVYLGKGEEQGLDKAVAEGNVGVVRDRPDDKGGPPVRSVGRADKAIYTAKDGNVELTGTPRVLSGMNSHVATSPDTVMVINESGQLTTTGPSRTELRQEPKADPAPKP